MTWSVNVRAWEAPQRREASLYALVASVVLIASAYALRFMLGDDAALWHTVFAVALVLVALFMIALHALAPRRVAAGSHEGAAAPAEAAAEPQTLRLKCGNCATESDIADTGARPLYHTCPGCGAEGVLRAPEGAAPAPAPEAAPPAAATLRRLKLRCASCQTIFVVEDHGARPMRTECPGCGRVGELK